MDLLDVPLVVTDGIGSQKSKHLFDHMQLDDAWADVLGSPALAALEA